MTPELGPTARSLVNAARGSLGPDAAVAARVRARVAAAVGGASAGAAATIPTPTSGSILGSSMGLKLAVAVVLASAVVGTMVARLALAPSRRGGDMEGLVDLSLATEPRPGPGRDHSDVGRADAGRGDLGRRDLGKVNQPIGDPGVRQGPARVRPELVRPDGGDPDAGRPNIGQSARPAADRPNPDRATNAAPSLAREVELIDRAMAELRLGHPTAALRTIDVFDRETAGRGQLAEDAAAIEIEAHCRLHDPVTATLDAFDRKWSSSAQRSRLSAACAR